jgi:hypothetical protein
VGRWSLCARDGSEGGAALGASGLAGLAAGAAARLERLRARLVPPGPLPRPTVAPASNAKNGAQVSPDASGRGVAGTTVPLGGGVELRGVAFEAEGVQLLPTDSAEGIAKPGSRPPAQTYLRSARCSCSGGWAAMRGEAAVSGSASGPMRWRVWCGPAYSWSWRAARHSHAAQADSKAVRA